MASRNWDDFKEPLDHEISPCSIVLSSEGYRVDERNGGKQGIRDHSQIKDIAGNKLKCCDYFYLANGKFFCLEFSNLHRQYIDCNSSFNDITRVIKQLPKKEQRLLQHAHPEKIILNEIVKKFQHTDFLLKNIYDPNFHKITNLPDERLERHFFVIWYPHNETELLSIYGRELAEIDIARLFDSIQDKLRNELCCQLFAQLDGNQIFVIPLSTFSQKYCTI